jgi:hypothetical protein
LDKELNDLRKLKDEPSLSEHELERYVERYVDIGGHKARTENVLMLARISKAHKDNDKSIVVDISTLCGLILNRTVKNAADGKMREIWKKLEKEAIRA